MMKMVTDFHSHILPGIDDGSQSVEESLALLRMEAEQGICRVVATPHFYAHHDTPERFLRRREAAWTQLREAMGIHSRLPAVVLGAEVLYFPGMSSSEVLPELTIGGTPFLLLEMPSAPWTETMYREMEGIYTKQGITPVIAHVERYIGPFSARGVFRRLEALPVLVQANAEFFLHRGTAGLALRLLREERIHLLGSDCHNLTDRAPNLGPALERIGKRLGEGAVERIQACEEMIFSAQ